MDRLANGISFSEAKEYFKTMCKSIGPNLILRNFQKILHFLEDPVQEVCFVNTLDDYVSYYHLVVVDEMYLKSTCLTDECKVLASKILNIIKEKKDSFTFEATFGKRHVAGIPVILKKVSTVLTDGFQNVEDPNKKLLKDNWIKTTKDNWIKLTLEYVKSGRQMLKYPGMERWKAEYIYNGILMQGDDMESKSPWTQVWEAMSILRLRYEYIVSLHVGVGTSLMYVKFEKIRKKRTPAKKKFILVKEKIEGITEDTVEDIWDKYAIEEFRTSNKENVPPIENGKCTNVEENLLTLIDKYYDGDFTQLRNPKSILEEMLDKTIYQSTGVAPERSMVSMKRPWMLPERLWLSTEKEKQAKSTKSSLNEQTPMQMFDVQNTYEPLESASLLRTPQIKPKAMSSEVPNMKAKLIEGLSVPLESDKAMRMMRLMGWKGGALGVRGDGLMEPLQPQLDLQKRVGLGHKINKVTSVSLSKSQKKLKNEKIKAKKPKPPVNLERITDLCDKIDSLLKQDTKENVNEVNKVVKSKTKSNDINKVKRQQNFEGLKTITAEDLRADENMTMKYADSDVDNLVDCGSEPKAKEATIRIQFLIEVLELIQKDKPYTLIRFVKKLSKEHIAYTKAMIDCFNDRERLKSDSDRENILYNTILEEMMIHSDMWMTIQLYMNDARQLLIIKTDKTDKLDYLIFDIPKNGDSMATHCVLDSFKYGFIPISKKKFVADKIVAARLLFYFVYSRETEMVCQFSSIQTGKLRSFIERVASLLNRQKELDIGLGCEERALFRRALGRMDSMCVNVHYDSPTIKFQHIRLTKVYFDMRCSICQPQFYNNEYISEQISDENIKFEDAIEISSERLKESNKVAKNFDNLNVELKNSKYEIQDSSQEELCKDITDNNNNNGNLKDTDMQLDKNEDSVDSESCGSYYDNAEYLAERLASDFDFDAAIKLEWDSLERAENDCEAVGNTIGDLKEQYVLNNSVETIPKGVCDEGFETAPKNSIRNIDITRENNVKNINDVQNFSKNGLVTNRKSHEREMPECKVGIQEEDVLCKTNKFMEVFEKMREKMQNNKDCEEDKTFHDDQDVVSETSKLNVEESIDSHQQSKELESQYVSQNLGTVVHNKINVGDAALLDLSEIIDRCEQKIFDAIINNKHVAPSTTDTEILGTNECIIDKYDNVNDEQTKNSSLNSKEMDVVDEDKIDCKIEASTSVHHNIDNNSIQNFVENDSYDGVRLNNNKDIIKKYEDKDSRHEKENLVDIPILVDTEEIIDNIEVSEIELDMKKPVEATPGDGDDEVVVEYITLQKVETFSAEEEENISINNV